MVKAQFWLLHLFFFYNQAFLDADLWPEISPLASPGQYNCVNRSLQYRGDQLLNFIVLLL